MNRLQTLRDTIALLREWAWLEAGTRTGRPAAAPARDQPRRLAFFVWALPPNSNAGVYRPLSFLQYGAAHGRQIDEFHGESPPNQSEHGEELTRRLPVEVRLHCIPDDLRIPSYRWYPRVDGGFKQAIAHARRAIAELAGRPPHADFASGPPFFVFVAAHFVAQQFGVPLILDYRDEWTDCPFAFADSSGNDRYWERRCVASAQAVLFTTQSLLEHQCRVFPELQRARAHVVHNGWEPSDFPAIEFSAARASSDDHITRSYVDHLADHLGPKEFLERLANFLHESDEWRRRPRLVLIGRRSSDVDAACRRFPFAANLEVVDHVGKREAVRRMGASDALLFLGGEMCRRYRPGKLYDYIALGRPIIACGPQGETWVVVRRLDGDDPHDPADGDFGRSRQQLKAIELPARRRRDRGMSRRGSPGHASQAHVEHHRLDPAASSPSRVMTCLSESGRRDAIAHE